MKNLAGNTRNKTIYEDENEDELLERVIRRIVLKVLNERDYNERDLPDQSASKTKITEGATV